MALKGGFSYLLKYNILRKATLRRFTLSLFLDPLVQATKVQYLLRTT